MQSSCYYSNYLTRFLEIHKFANNSCPKCNKIYSRTASALRFYDTFARLRNLTFIFPNSDFKSHSLNIRVLSSNICEGAMLKVLSVGSNAVVPRRHDNRIHFIASVHISLVRTYTQEGRYKYFFIQESFIMYLRNGSS
jgi:hypothetical protein